MRNGCLCVEYDIDGSFIECGTGRATNDDGANDDEEEEEATETEKLVFVVGAAFDAHLYSLAVLKFNSIVGS